MARCVPGQHEVGIGVVGSRASWAPFDGVDLLTVGLQVMNTSVLFHAPKLTFKTKHNIIITLTPS